MTSLPYYCRTHEIRCYGPVGPYPDCDVVLLEEQE